jgi:hypothetical protein
MTECVQDLYKVEGNSENNESKSTLLIEDNNVSSDKVLEPLEVLENIIVGKRICK